MYLLDKNNTKLFNQLENTLGHQLPKSKIRTMGEYIVMLYNQGIDAIIAINGQQAALFELNMGHNFNDVQSVFRDADLILETTIVRGNMDVSVRKISLRKATKMAYEFDAPVTQPSVQAMLKANTGINNITPNQWKYWMNQFELIGNRVMAKYLEKAIEANSALFH